MVGRSGNVRLEIFHDHVLDAKSALLSHGGAVKLTTSRYFTPSGASIHGKGIVPDIVAQGAEDPPAELLTGKNAASLQSRDKEVSLALGTLKDQVRVAAATKGAEQKARLDAADSDPMSIVLRFTRAR